MSLTPDGLRLADAILARATDERQAVFSGFTARELDGLAAMLDRIEENVRKLLSQRP